MGSGDVKVALIIASVFIVLIVSVCLVGAYVSGRERDAQIERARTCTHIQYPERIIDCLRVG